MNIRYAIPAVLAILASAPLMSQSKIDVTTVLKDNFFDKNGNPLTGKGVVIGDVDSGVDIFHPMFFFADGGTFDWVDVDNDGKFTPGVDGVDLNNDGKIEKDEILRVLTLKNNTWDLIADNASGSMNPQFDFLYIDRNGNKKRDFGPGAGFTEKDPAYGEPLFIVIDANHNGKLDPGEKIVMLKTSKVRAIREKDGTIRRRGTDLIYSEEDSIGHGTGVAGLLIGGHKGIEKICGLAPDAEMIFANIKYDYTPRFVRNFPDLVNFLRDEKVNVLLFEDGEWMWEFMDGSSPEEEIVNEMARDGIPVVGGSGNFSTGNMMIIDTLRSGEEAVYKIDAAEVVEGQVNNGVFISFLWQDSTNNISFSIETPDKKTGPAFTRGEDFVKVGKYNVAYARQVSPKGTVMFKLSLSRQDSGVVEGIWKINVKPENQTVIRGYVVDISQSWEGSSHWVSNHVTGNSSVTFPSTADSLMAIGAYVVNFGWFDKVGNIATYSSRGYNLDGKLGVEISGPGHTTFTTGKDLQWMTFSGTSSAAPHVAGTIALMLQYEPGLTQVQIKDIIRRTATKDNFTGNVPNPVWGYGKLNTEEALRYLINNHIGPDQSGQK